jgi:hypothetical protein
LRLLRLLGIDPVLPGTISLRVSIVISVRLLCPASIPGIDVPASDVCFRFLESASGSVGIVTLYRGNDDGWWRGGPTAGPAVGAGVGSGI